MVTNNFMRVPLLVGLLGVTLGGCDDLLTVSDPQRYTSEDLDESLDAVINGVEGDFYAGMDNLVNATSLNSDEAQHTGTWIGYDDLDHGRFHYSNASGGGGLGSGDNVMVNLLRVRYFAQSSQDRFARVLEGEAASSPMTARAKTVEGWTNLLLAQNFCEAPAEQGGPAVSDAEIGQLAITTLTDALQTAQAAGATDEALRAQAGRARAHLLLGNYSEALSDAQAIPTDFAWEAQFSSNSGRQYNAIVQLSTAGQNRASGIREYYWERVDTVADAMRDPFTGEADSRLAVLYDGSFGVDGLTPHYSQWKFQTLDSDIQLTDGREMRLIEAEVAWRNNDLDTALQKINEVRTVAGLTPHPVTNDANQVFEYLLYERFAELFWEGQRMSDLHRFGLVDDFIAEGRFGAETESSRPTKFPIAELEVLNNTSFTDKGIAARCLPMSG
jgi:hypothetical protein